MHLQPLVVFFASFIDIKSVEAYFLLFILVFFSLLSRAYGDTTTIPLNRRIFHDKIKAQQKKGRPGRWRLDELIKVSYQSRASISGNGRHFQKSKYVKWYWRSIHNWPPTTTKYDTCVTWSTLCEILRIDWRCSWKLCPPAPPLLVIFTEIMFANLNGRSMAPFIHKVPYEVGLINSEELQKIPAIKKPEDLVP